MIYNWLKVLFTPSCWIQNTSYSSVWDYHLNELMLTHKFKNITKYHAMLGDNKLWIANHPYASMCPYDRDVRAKRSTILKAHKKLIEDMVNTNVSK